MGAISWQLFGKHADWCSLYFLHQPLQEAEGVVAKVIPSHFTFGDDGNGRSIRTVHYQFKEHTGVGRTGTSWTEQSSPKTGDKVRIEYLSARPVVSRIVNLRSAPLPLWVGAVICFPLAGLACILRAGFNSRYEM